MKFKLKLVLFILFILLFIHPVGAVDSLVGHWAFDEGTGVYANDSSGFNNNGTLTGSGVVWSLEAINGTALDFNGTNGYVNLGVSASLNITTTFTFSFWNKQRAGTSGMYSTSGAGGVAGTLNIYVTDTTVCAHVHGAPAIIICGNGDFANKWNYYTVTRNASNYWRVYVNNVVLDTVISAYSVSLTDNNNIGRTNYGYANGLIDEFRIYNYEISTAERTALYEQFQPAPTYPSKGLVISGSYPPLTTTVNFTWVNTITDSSEIIVAKDSNFNIIAGDAFTSNDFYPFTLESGTYYWKVRQYNSTTLSYVNTSGTQNFTINLVSGATGTGINGVVYEIVNGLDTPIDAASVFIYNNTWSSNQITGSNGYYLFSGLANGTYNVYAVKNGYDTTSAFPVTVNGSITTNDILMKIYISPYVPNFVFEKFVVRDLFDNSFVGVTTTVYEGDSQQSSFTGMTDSTGSVVFQLIKDQRYRVTFSGGGISSTVTVYVYAKEETYFVRILTGFPTGGDRYTDISTNLTPVFINSSWSNLSLIYNDSKLSTSLIWFYVTNMSTGNTCYYTASSTNSVTFGCPVISAGLYQFGFNATSSIYGFFQEDKVINFGAGTQAASVLNGKADRTLLQWGSIGLIIFVAALFSQKSVKYGAIVVPFLAFALWMPPLSTFEPIVGGSAETNFILLSCALVIGIMIYLRMSENKADVVV